jgi:TatD DNase family protein
MNFTDTHCHVHFDDYLPDAEQVIKNSIASKVTKMICVGVSLEDSQKAIAFAEKYENVWATVGAHPHDGGDFLDHSHNTEVLNKLSKNPKVVAVGEIGLDYFHEYTPRQKQIEVLRSQIEIGLPTKLPFVFHVRDAWDDFWNVIDPYQGIHGVIHSFSAHEEQLQKVLEHDFYVGLNGIMTFTKDEQQLAAAKKIPLGKLLLETDAPFLTPKPYRGKRCEPKHVVLTAEFLANLRGESLEGLVEATTKNTSELFRI